MTDFKAGDKVVIARPIDHDTTVKVGDILTIRWVDGEEIGLISGDDTYVVWPDEIRHLNPLEKLMEIV